MYLFCMRLHIIIIIRKILYVSAYSLMFHIMLTVLHINSYNVDNNQHYS